MALSAVGCVMRARWFVGGGRGVVCAAIDVLWVRACSPLFFLLPLGVPLGWGKRKVAAWGERLVFSFCVGGVVDYGCEVACEW